MSIINLDSIYAKEIFVEDFIKEENILDKICLIKTTNKDKLKLYKLHSKIAQHFFCSICGIYTHHNPRSNPAMTGFNLGCLDEINTFNLENIQILNGQDHPLDKK